MARTPEECRAQALDALAHISEGEFLSDYCKARNVPYSTVYKDIFDQPDGNKMYSRAREMGYSKRLEDLEIASYGLLSEAKTGALADPTATVQAFKEWRTTAQWNAERFAKGRFSTRTEVEHSGEVRSRRVNMKNLKPEELAQLESMLERIDGADEQPSDA